MKQISSIHAGWLVAGLSVASLSLVGCLRDVGFGSSAAEVSGSGGGIGSSGSGGSHVGTTSSSGGVVGTGSSGVGGGFGVSSSSGGDGGISFSGSSGVGGSFGVSSSSGGDGGISFSGSSGVGGSFGASSSSGSFSGSSSSGGDDGGTSSTQECQLGSAPVPCDFSHLNADCAPFGAVCDFLYGQCSCCFVHDESTCTSDADCEASFGASSFCSAGTCGCK